jgi:flagellar basal-body rod modification protein FlgD
MAVPGVSGATDTTATTGTTKTETKDTSTLDYDAFLRLLIAQIRNQDPLEPTKSSDQIAQLATFSQVEKSIQMNDRLASILSSSNLALADSLVGKTVIFPDGGPSGTVVAAKTMSDGVMVLLDSGVERMVEEGIIIGGTTT